jgi:cytochrome c-type biogenesis protein CcmE
MRRYAAFVIPALGLAAVLIGFLVFSLGDHLVYYRTPTEVLDLGGDDDARVRLGGQVSPGVEEGPGVVRFAVTDGHTDVLVEHTGTPQQLVRPGIGVVVEGTWDGALFRSDTMIIKHDEQYRTEDGGVYVPGVPPTVP